MTKGMKNPMSTLEVPAAIGEVAKKMNAGVLLVFSFFASSFLYVLTVAKAQGSWPLAALLAFVVGPIVIRVAQLAIAVASEAAWLGRNPMMAWSVFWLDMLWMVGGPAAAFAAGVFLVATQGFFYLATWHEVPFTAAYFFGVAAANATPMLPAGTKQRAHRW